MTESAAGATVRTMSDPGPWRFGLPPQLVGEMAEARERENDVERDVERRNTGEARGWWPSGSTVVRGALLAIGAFIVGGWVLTALTR